MATNYRELSVLVPWEIRRNPDIPLGDKTLYIAEYAPLGRDFFTAVCIELGIPVPGQPPDQ